MIREIVQCRICGNTQLESIIHLGNLSLTGVFPKRKDQEITTGPLELVKCMDDEKSCGLVQLKHSYDGEEMYGDNYGYRSGLNASMVKHLQDVAAKAITLEGLKPGDLIIDIGSNDGTLLRSYPKGRYQLAGIDPTALKFKSYYTEDIQIIPEFFSAEGFKMHFGDRRARIVTSIAMFYDLESPENFVRAIFDILDDDGIWIFEQSYMPRMIEKKSYDTICHEHVEYYGLKQIRWILDRVGLKILDIAFNEVNGGSFMITAAKKNSPKTECSGLIRKILDREHDEGYDTLRPFLKFRDVVLEHRDELLTTLRHMKKEDKKVFGYGASTKGNVLLQYCGLTENDIPYIGEVNDDKFGSYTPKTLIPIISEKEARAMKPDYFLVLPWHFRDTIIRKESDYLSGGGHLLFPLPEIEIV